MAVLHDGSGVMGDRVVVTWSPRVARWAMRVGHAKGPLGTTSRLTPVVILLSGEVIEALLGNPWPPALTGKPRAPRPRSPGKPGEARFRLPPTAGKPASVRAPLARSPLETGWRGHSALPVERDDRRPASPASARSYAGFFSAAPGPATGGAGAGGASPGFAAALDGLLAKA